MAAKIAIVGTREPDATQAAAVFQLSHILSLMGFEIWTGGAFGIDERAMKGTVPARLTVVLPWPEHNRHLIPEGATVIVLDETQHRHWVDTIQLHPNANRVLAVPRTRKLMARNCGIVENSQLLIAAPGRGGGTRQSMRVAKSLGVPIYEIDQNKLSAEIVVRQVMAWISNARLIA